MKDPISDCDGDMAEPGRYSHLPAFNQTFRKLGPPVQGSEEENGIKRKIAWGKERMSSQLTTEFIRQVGLPVDPGDFITLQGQEASLES